MPDDAPKLEPLADGLGYRVRVCYVKARSRFRIPTTDETLAASRALVLVELGATLANVPTDLAKSLLEQAAEADGPALKRVQAVVAKLVIGAVPVKRKPESPRAAWTVRELGEAWTEGDLAKDFP